MIDSLTKLQADMNACRRCLEAGYEITPGAIFRCGTVRDIMLIGQAPGITEVAARRPFNAGSGRRLFQWLGEAGWDEAEFREKQYMTAVTKCYPGKGKNGKGDRVPSKAEQALCRPFLDREMALVKPRLIIPVGGLAIKLFFPKSAKLTDVIGTAVYFPPEALTNPVNYDIQTGQWLKQPDFPSLITKFPTDGRFLVPLPHPSGASLWPNRPENKALINQAVQILTAVRMAWGL